MLKLNTSPLRSRTVNSFIVVIITSWYRLKLVYQLVWPFLKPKKEKKMHYFIKRDTKEKTKKSKRSESETINCCWTGPLLQQSSYYQCQWQFDARPNAIQGHLCMHAYSTEGWLHNALALQWRRKNGNSSGNYTSVWFLQLLFTYIFTVNLIWILFVSLFSPYTVIFINKLACTSRYKFNWVILKIYDIRVPLAAGAFNHTVSNPWKYFLRNYLKKPSNLWLNHMHRNDKNKLQQMEQTVIQYFPLLATFISKILNASLHHIDQIDTYHLINFLN